MSAPASTSTRIASPWFSAAAHITAVSPSHFSRALTSAPRAINTFKASTRPVRAAVITTGSPSGVVVFGSAPAAINASIDFALPLIAASVIGCRPYRFVAFAFAPARSSMVTSSSIVALRCPVQRGRPVEAGGVDIGFAAQLCAHRVVIAPFDRVDEGRIALRGHEAGGQDEGQ